jgi:hypothetical protein
MTQKLQVGLRAGYLMPCLGGLTKRLRVEKET